jgi:tetratricopeptide (TPR) repeat protein
MDRKHILGLGLLLAAATSVPAFAQPAMQGYPACTKQVSAAESDLAHQKYIAGKQDYDEGNYDSALRRFRDAYNLDCTKHELLIIISAAYERKGDKKEAIAALETYVARAPSAPDVGTYQAKIENLKKQVAAAQTATAPATTTAPTTTAPANGGAPPPTGEVREHTAWPWVVTGVGGAVALIGIVLIATTSSLPAGCNEATQQCDYLPGENRVTDAGKLKDRQEEAGRIFAQPKIGLGLTIGGLALVGGGLIWHFLEPTGPKESSSKTKVRPALAPGFAGLSVGGTF